MGQLVALWSHVGFATGREEEYEEEEAAPWNVTCFF